MPRDWRSVVDGMTRVQRLVHLAMRMDLTDEEQLRRELLKQRRVYYEDELTAQAARAGCPKRKGRLANGEILTMLNEESAADGSSIVNTYNYDLARAILVISQEIPTANRFVYAKRLASWEARRAGWKNAQIAMHTEVSARTKAQQDFYRLNGLLGVAVLRPLAAICPVCKGWIRRGEVPLRVAQNNPPPYHVGCPHNWETRPERVAKEECDELWMGS